MSEIRLNHFVAAGVLALVWLSGCSPKARPSVNKKGCDGVALQEKKWSPESTRGALDCILASNDQTLLRQNLSQLPPESFRQTAAWLNGHFVRDARGFIRLLTRLPKATGSLLTGPAAERAFLSESSPSFAPFVGDLLSLSMQLRLLEKSGDWGSARVSARGVLSGLLLVAETETALAALAPTARVAAWVVLENVFLDLLRDAPTRDFLVQISQPVTCRKGGLTQSPVGLVLSDFNHSPSGSESVAHLLRNFGFWKKLCDPDVQLSEEGLGRALQFVDRNFHSLQMLSRAGFPADWPFVTARFVADFREILDLGRERAVHHLFENLRHRELSDQLISRLPERKHIEALLTDLRQIHSTETLGRNELGAVGSTIEALQLTPELVAEWQTLLRHFGPGSLAGVGRYIAQGKLASLGALLGLWARFPKAAVAPVMRIWRQVAETPVPASTARQTDLIARGLLNACLAPAFSGQVSEILACLGRAGQPVAFRPEFLERKVLDAYLEKFNPQSREFALLQAMAREERLRQPVIVRAAVALERLFRGKTVPFNHVFDWLSEGLAPGSPHLGSLRATLTHMRPDLNDPLRGLFNTSFRSRRKLSEFTGWEAWVKRDLAQVVPALFSAPQNVELLAILSNLTTRRLTLKPGLTTGVFSALDHLFWSAQVSPLGLGEDDLIAHKFMSELVQLRNAEDARLWLENISKILSRGERAFGLLDPLTQSQTGRQLRMSRKLLNEIRTNVEPREILALARILAQLVPEQYKPRERVELLTAFQRMALLPALGHALAPDLFVKRPTPADLERRGAGLRAWAAALAANPYDQADFLEISRLNQETAGLPLGAYLAWSIRGAQSSGSLPDAEALGTWMASATSRILLPVMRGARISLKGDELRDEMISLMLVFSDEAPKSFQAFSEWLSGPQGASAERGELLRELENPAGRTPFFSWLASGSAAGLLDWTLLLEPPPPERN